MPFFDEMGCWAKWPTNREITSNAITLTKHDIGVYLLFLPIGGSLKHI